LIHKHFSDSAFRNVAFVDRASTKASTGSTVYQTSISAIKNRNVDIVDAFLKEVFQKSRHRKRKGFLNLCLNLWKIETILGHFKDCQRLPLLSVRLCTQGV
jgi:hypothetical protein